MEFDIDVKLETERLILRYLNKDDTHDIFNNINHDKEVLLFFLDKYCEKEEEMTLDRTINFCQANKRYLLAIERKDNKEVIGIMLQCSTPSGYFTTSEIGFAIGRKHWNKGYTTEALNKFIEFLFEEGIHKITCSHINQNVASGRVMQKCHMIYEGERVHDVYWRDQYWNTKYYYLINPREK